MHGVGVGKLWPGFMALEAQPAKTASPQKKVSVWLRTAHWQYPYDSPGVSV